MLAIAAAIIDIAAMDFLTGSKGFSAASDRSAAPDDASVALCWHLAPILRNDCKYAFPLLGVEPTPRPELEIAKIMMAASDSYMVELTPCIK